MMISQVVRTLVEKGLMSRNRNQKDSRSYMIDLTEEGFRLGEIALIKVESVDSNFLVTWTNQKQMMY